MTTVADVDMSGWNKQSATPFRDGAYPNTIRNGSTTASITQYGITWTFDAPVQYGQFVTGDYYIIDSGSGVTVSSITPTASGGENGSMKNPVAGAGQGMTISGEDYEASMLVSLPLALVSGDSLVSSVSLTGSEPSDWEGSNVSSSAFLRSASVLTVLSSHPAVGTFRPSYSDRSHTLYNTSQINASVLPGKAIAGVTAPSHAGFSTLEYFERGLERPWILFGNDWQSRSIHPIENMKNYHEQIGAFLSEASVMLMTDTTNMDTLRNGYIQVGIDYYYNKTDSSIWAWPLVFTGLLLNDSAMYNFWINNPGVRTQRGHEKLYYVNDVTPSTTSAIITSGETWVDWSNDSGQYVAFRKQVNEEYEHLHPSEWIGYSPHHKGEVYRCQHDVYPLVGMTLSSILVDAEVVADVNAMLAHDPIKDYCDRWMSDIFQTGFYNGGANTYREEMEANAVFTIYNYNYGSGGTAFINEMWSTYR